jgi:hypothetical protein
MAHGAKRFDLKAKIQIFYALRFALSPLPFDRPLIRVILLL